MKTEAGQPRRSPGALALPAEGARLRVDPRQHRGAEPILPPRGRYLQASHAWLQHSGRPLSWRSRNTTLGVAGACSCAEAGIPPSDTTRSPWTSRARLPEWRRDARFARAEAGVSARTTHARAGRPYRSSGTRLALWLVAGRKHSCVAACRPQERSAQSHADVARGCVRGLGSRFLEGVGDRVLEAQRAAFARGGIPCVGSAPCAGGLEERLVEPGLDRVLWLGRSGVWQRRRRVLRRALSSPSTAATAARPRRPSNATGRTTMSRQSLSSSRNACDAASVSPVSSAARPRLPLLIIDVKRSFSARVIGVARAAKSVASTLAAETERGVGRVGE